MKSSSNSFHFFTSIFFSLSLGLDCLQLREKKRKGIVVLILMKKRSCLITVASTAISNGINLTSQVISSYHPDLVLTKKKNHHEQG